MGGGGEGQRGGRGGILQGPKRWINHTCNTSIAFDRSALRDVTAMHLHDLQRTHVASSGLGEPRTLPADQLEALEVVFGRGVDVAASSSARVSDWEVVHRGDVVEGHNGETSFLGKVLQHFMVEDRSATLLETWRCTASEVGSTTWDCTRPGLSLVRTGEILTACVHCRSEETAVVLRTPRARQAVE